MSDTDTTSATEPRALCQLEPGATFTLRVLVLRHEDGQTEVVTTDQTRSSKIVWLDDGVQTVDPYMDGWDALGDLEPRSETSLLGSALPWIGGGFTEVAFCGTDGGTSYTVWLDDGFMVTPRAD